MCTVRKKAAKLNPLDQKLDLARKLDTLSVSHTGCLPIILSRDYGLNYKTRLHKYTVCAKAWEFSVSSLQKYLEMFVCLSTGN